MIYCTALQCTALHCKVLCNLALLQSLQLAVSNAPCFLIRKTTYSENSPCLRRHGARLLHFKFFVLSKKITVLLFAVMKMRQHDHVFELQHMTYSLLVFTFYSSVLGGASVRR